jgi:hypothetical protein
MEKKNTTVETILDSRLFRQVQDGVYNIWSNGKGYPDADNMWVDKDDVFAEDKVWEFKAFKPRLKNTYKGNFLR